MCECIRNKHAHDSCCDYYFFFFFNDTATTEIYTLSLHDALPIYRLQILHNGRDHAQRALGAPVVPGDRKSTRLNSSHLVISYAVFCLKKKKKNYIFRTETTKHDMKTM